MEEENLKNKLTPHEKEIYEIGWNDAVKSIRCALRLKKMGMFKGIGIGEISGAASASATLMAISNAIGAVVNEYPATPAVILKAIKEKAKKA